MRVRKLQCCINWDLAYMNSWTAYSFYFQLILPNAYINPRHYCVKCGNIVEEAGIVSAKHMPRRSTARPATIPSIDTPWNHLYILDKYLQPNVFISHFKVLWRMHFRRFCILYYSYTWPFFDAGEWCTTSDTWLEASTADSRPCNT